MYPAILIEDSATIRDTLIPSLAELADIQVLAYAETEDDGVHLLAHDGADAKLVILDMFLRKGTGLGLLAKCFGLTSRACVVVLTNHATVDIRERCTRLGAQAIFDKSTQLDEFFDYCRGLPQTYLTPDALGESLRRADQVLGNVAEKLVPNSVVDDTDMLPS